MRHCKNTYQSRFTAARAVIAAALVVTLAVILPHAHASRVPDGKIKHLLVLCLENHSFDHLLGYLEGVGTVRPNDPRYYNLEDANNASSRRYYLGIANRTYDDPDPPHDFASVQRQQRGGGNGSAITNGGFASEYAKIGGDAQRVMEMYTPEQVPVISALARNFKVFARWYASIPGPTEVNKLFLHAATSHSAVDSCLDFNCTQYPISVPSIYDSLHASGYSYSIHYHDWCEVVDISPVNWRASKFVNDQDFKILYEKMAANTLDTYTFLVPRIDYQDPQYPYPNTQHPGEDVRAGEDLIKNVYEHLRASPAWNSSALLIVYDEHGGYYDSVPTEHTLPNPSPDVKSVPFEFDFEHLGVRVPAILVSPWVQKGVDTSTVFDHAAVPATVKALFALESDFLNDRDRASNVFVTQQDLLSEARTDCPLTLPSVYPSWEDVPRYLYRYKPAYGVDLYNSEETIELGLLLISRFPEASRERMRRVMDRIYNETACYWFEIELKRALGYKTQATTPLKHLGFINECQTYITLDHNAGAYVAMFFAAVAIAYTVFLAKYFNIENFGPVAATFALVCYSCDLRHAVSLCFSFLVGSNIAFALRARKRVPRREVHIQDGVELSIVASAGTAAAGASEQHHQNQDLFAQNDGITRSNASDAYSTDQETPQYATRAHVALMIALIAVGVHARKYVPLALLYALESACVLATLFAAVRVCVRVFRARNGTRDGTDTTLLTQSLAHRCACVQHALDAVECANSRFETVACAFAAVCGTVLYAVVMQSRHNIFGGALSRCAFEEIFTYQMFLVTCACAYAYFTRTHKGNAASVLAQYAVECGTGALYGVTAFLARARTLDAAVHVWVSAAAFVLEACTSSAYFFALSVACAVISAGVSAAGIKAFATQRCIANRINVVVATASVAASFAVIVLAAYTSMKRTDADSFFWPQPYC